MKPLVKFYCLVFLLTSTYLLTSCQETPEEAPAPDPGLVAGGSPLTKAELATQKLIGSYWVEFKKSRQNANPLIDSTLVEITRDPDDESQLLVSFSAKNILLVAKNPRININIYRDTAYFATTQYPGEGQVGYFPSNRLGGEFTYKENPGEGWQPTINFSGYRK